MFLNLCIMLMNSGRRNLLKIRKLHKRLVKLNKKTIPLLLFSLLALFLLKNARASTTSYVIEAENGNLQKGAQSLSVDGVSYVQFNNPANLSNELFHTCYPNAFCDKNNNPVILNGFNLRDIGDNSYMSKFASSTQLTKIKNKGFNVLRLAMRWEDFQPNPGTNGFDESKMQALKALVNNAKTAGLYIILDPLHGTGKGNCSGTNGHIPAWAQVIEDGVCKQRIGAINNHAENYIKRIASEYSEESHVVAIDLANEIQPIPYTNDIDLLKMYNGLIEHVRSVDNDKILIIEPQGGNKLINPNAIVNEIINKYNIVYSIHDYFGGAFDSNGNIIAQCNESGYNTNSGILCGNQTYENKQGYINPPKNKPTLETNIQANLNMLDTEGVKLPLLIGEYNIVVGQPNDVQWRKDTVKVYNKYNLSRILWLYYNKGYGYHDSNSIGEMSATSWTSPTDDTPGTFNPWVDDLLSSEK